MYNELQMQCQIETDKNNREILCSNGCEDDMWRLEVPVGSEAAGGP